MLNLAEIKIKEERIEVVEVEVDLIYNYIKIILIVAWFPFI